MMINSIRLATKADIPRIAEIIVYGWRTAYRGIIPDKVLFNERTVQKAMDRYASIIESPDLEVDVWDDGIIKGTMTHHKADEDDLTDAYDLMAIYMEPQFKGQGIGSQLLTSAEDKAKVKGFKTMVIWTLEKNSATIGFYEKFGYKRDGVKKYMDAWNAEIIRFSKVL